MNRTRSFFLRRAGFLVALSLVPFTPSPSFAQEVVEPAVYVIGGQILKSGADSGRTSDVRSILAPQAIAVDPSGDLIAMTAGGAMWRVETESGEAEKIGLLGLGTGDRVDIAFDPTGRLWLTTTHGGHTSIFRFEADFGGRVLLGELALEVVGIAFRGPEIVLLSSDLRLYRLDGETLVFEAITGPFETRGAPLSGLSISGDGRFFTIQGSIPIAPPPPPYAAELLLDQEEVRLFGSVASGVGPAVRREGCFADAATHCIGRGRFEIQIDWRAPEGPSTAAQSTRFVTSDSGLFSFGGPNNLEVLVKVLDGCAINDHFWVFASSATDLEHTIRVHDTFTGQSVTYPQGAGPQLPITDTSAFETCP